MLISDRARFLFVHVQKTGGSTIDQTLTGGLPDARRIKSLDRHAPLQAILREEPELLDYWTVGFVRNPWARLLSWHRMVQRFVTSAERGNEKAVTKLQRNQFLRVVAEEYLDFESFVLRGPDRFRRLTVPQVRYLTAPQRRVDFVGRQESLEADVAAIRARLGLPAGELVSTNIDRERPDYREVYSTAMRDKVAELYDADVRAFGYRF